MIGYVGLAHNPERIRRLQRLAAPSAESVVYDEQGFAIVLQPPPASSNHSVHRSQVAADPCRMLALEGYLMDIDPESAARPAHWLLGQHARLGMGAFKSLNGAYSFCLFDRRERRARIGACAFGRRDLYYLREGEGILFASDLEDLLRLAARRPGLASDQIYSSFLCGATYGGDTLLAGVRRALPGSILDIAPPSVLESNPTPLEPPSCDNPVNENDALEVLDERLRTAVSRVVSVTHRRTVLMSSGVDSSLVAAYVRSVTGELDALTVSLPPPSDETEDAGAIVRALGGVHHICRLRFDNIDLMEEMNVFVRLMEEPSSLGLGLPMMQVARMGRALTDGFVCGVSADVLFSNLLPNSGASNDSIYHYMFRRIEPDYVRQVVRLNGPHPDEIVRHLRSRFPDDPQQEMRLNFQIEGGLVIRFAARLARFHQGEALFPYLDRDVIDLALCLPSHLRGPRKPLLRKLAHRHYSADLQRPLKVPFAAYPIEWLQAAGRLDALLDMLEEPRTRDRGVFCESGLQDLIRFYRTGSPERPWHLVLWQLVVFELFCRRFVDGDSIER